MKMEMICACGAMTVKTGVLCVWCFLISVVVWGQDIQSGMWFADGRSMGMGGALMGGRNNCFDVKNIDTEWDYWQNTDGLLQEQESVIGYVQKTDNDSMQKTENDKMPKTHINKVSQTTCHAYVNGVLPYSMNDLAVLSAGAVVDRKQYSWWLHGGWSGKDEQFVSLLFGHTVGQKWRYVVGVAMYRLDIGFKTCSVTSETADVMSSETADVMSSGTADVISLWAADGIPSKTADVMPLNTADGVSSKTAEGMPLEAKDEAVGTGVSRAVLAFMAEAGVFYRPLESLQIGVWMGNPTLTHKDSLYFAADFHLGTVYDVSERLQFVLEFEKQLQHSLFAHFGMEMAIWRPSSKKWRVDGRAGVRYPYTEVSAGLGVAHLGKTKLHFDAAAVCDWKLGWSFATSVGVGF